MSAFQAEASTNVNVQLWGGSGAHDAPSDLTNAVAVAGGSEHSVALRSDGTVVAWGDNTYGQTNVPANLTNVVMVASGSDHCVILRANGFVVGWGDNSFGQSNIPVILTNVIGVSAREHHNLALRSDGTVVAWGKIWDGSDNIVETVPSGLDDVVKVAAGTDHSLAIRSNGTVVAWGNNDSGQCDVPSDATNIVSVAGGRQSSMALRSDGTVVVWGDLYDPLVSPMLTNIVMIAAGNEHGLALKADGTVIDWLYNAGGIVPVSFPEQVTAVACGVHYNIAALFFPESAVPTLGITLIPAVILSGDIGTNYLLQYANTVGPAAVWLDLVSITITNNPQYYPDVSAIGQPSRFYRLG